ncbi:glutamate--cysteine ligase [Comamonadaceae bacterium PP-2]
MVPHLITALTGPINELEQRMLDAMPAIERWFRLEWMEHTPAFYSAVDIRNAGFKLVPVDTSLFPGGWSSLTRDMLPLAVQAAQAAIEKICPEARNLLIVPDVRTDNSFYLANLLQMQRIFENAGLNVRFGSLDPAIKSAKEYKLHSGETILVEPLQRTRNRLGLKHFDPCTILLNNDLHAGVPGILEDLHEQYVLPPLHAGWSQRRRSNHLKAYEEVAKRFGKLLGIDPWLINPMHTHLGEIQVGKAADMERLRTEVDALLARVRRKYKEYGISEKPFVVIKPNNGAAHGDPLGGSPPVLSVRDSSELEALLRKPRGKAGSAKAANGPIDLFLREGVLTNERVHDAVAEPVVYMLDRYVVGGFYRIHAERSSDESTNAPGSRYVPLAFAESHHLPQPGEKPGASAPNRFYMYGVIARLAMLAASYEMEATDPQAEVY